MINTLLGNITGLFSKEYLLSAFLPALWFIAVMTAAALWVTGWEGPVEQFGAWTAGQKALAAVGGSIALAVFGYVLQALHPLFTELWSGRISSWPLLALLWGQLELGRAFQGLRYSDLSKRANLISWWNERFEAFATKAALQYHESGAAVPRSQARDIKAKIRRFSANSSQTHVGAVSNDLVDAYANYDGRSLQGVYDLFKRTVFLIHSEKSYSIQTCSTSLDREFATEVSIQPTTLGNIIASYNEYSFKRYNMEGELFWPRLRQVADQKFLEQLDDRKIVLDFALTSATLSGVFAMVATFGGPWLWHDRVFWTCLFMAGAALTVLFYWLAVIVARQLGELVRTAYDLFRWKLMGELKLEIPEKLTLGDERKLWEQVSQWIAYGVTAGDITFAIPKPKVQGSSS
jgi:hypothetical protein